MARGHARIKTSIWKDEHFLARSPDAQRVYFLLLSQPGLSFCGVIAYTARRWASLAKGTTAKTITRAVEELAGADFLVIDEEHEELWVRSFVKHDGVLTGGPKLLVAMWKDYLAIASPMIRTRFLDSLPADIRRGVPDGVSDPPSDGASHDQPDERPDTPSDASRARAAPAIQPLPSSPCHPAPATSPSEHSSSSSLDRVGRRSADDEDDEISPIEKTTTLIVDRRIAATTKVIKNPSGYRAQTLRNVDIELGDQLRDLLADGLTPEEVADALCPLPGTAVSPYPEAGEVHQPVWSEDDVTVDEHGRLVVVRSAS